MGICNSTCVNSRNEGNPRQLGDGRLGTSSDRARAESRECGGVFQTATRVSQTRARLTELGLTLPLPPKALAAYSPAVIRGEWVYTAGQLPLQDGQLISSGLVGDEVSESEGAEAARIAALNGLAAISSVVSDLDAITIAKVVGYVACAPGFTGQPNVVNGASLLLAEVLGERGQHARSAVGVTALPLGAPVEIEIIARVDTNAPRGIADIA